MMFAAFGLIAAVVFAVLLAAGVREPTRERLFLVGSLLVVSIVCLALSFVFKGQAQELQEQIDQASYQRLERDAEDQDDVKLPQNAAHADAAQVAASRETEPDPDDVQLPQNALH
jgi:hypothetical protein